jgi:hypothetical protein
MQIIKTLSERKTRIHRSILITQALSPLVMFVGALVGIPVLIIIGLAALMLVNLLAALTA